MIFVTKKIYNFFDGIEILIDAVLIGIFVTFYGVQYSLIVGFIPFWG